MSNQQKLTGIIACGGQSLRMGKDKGLIKYHDKPQRYFFYDLLNSVCDQTFISCRADQVASVANGYNFIIDNAEVAGRGPVSGLLSCFSEKPDTAILYIGCDYPFLSSKDIEKLIEERELKVDATCYINPSSNYPEPLLAIYEPSSCSKIKMRFHEGKYSLREFLEGHPVKKIIPDNVHVLKGVDTPEEYNSIIRSFKSID